MSARMHPMAEGTIASASADAKMLSKALQGGDVPEAMVWLKRVILKLESAVEIERMHQKRETGT